MGCAMGVHLADDARHHARRHQLRRVHTHAAVGGELPVGAPTLLLLLLLLLLPLLLLLLLLRWRIPPRHRVAGRLLRLLRLLLLLLLLPRGAAM